MSCVFCGAANKSREHVIGQQLGETLKSSRPLEPGMLRKGLTQRYTPPPGTDGEAFEWSTSGPDLVTTGVCTQCNTGWLSPLEDRAMPTLRPIVLGEEIDVEKDDQLGLAAWCYRTVLLMELVRPGASFKIIPQWRYAQFRQNGRPPTDVRIWLGSRTSVEEVVHAAIQRAPLTTLTSKLDGYFSLLTVGHLVILCSGRMMESEEPFFFDARSEGKALVRIWPASIRTAHWPSPQAIGDFGLEALGALIG